MYLAMYGDYLYCDNEFHVWLSDDVNYCRRSIVVIDTNTRKTVASIPFTISGTEMIGACGSDLLGAGTYSPIYVYDLDLALAGEECVWEEMH